MSRVCHCLACILLLALSTSTHATSSLSPPSNYPLTTYLELNNEEQGWICPTDSNYIVANWRDFRLGYRQIGVGRSTDGGQTWDDYLIPDTQQFYYPNARQSDPTMTVDRFGNFWMTALDYDAFSSNGNSTISLYVSGDKGATWNGPVPATTPFGSVFEDKQFTAVDRTGGLYDGNFYMAWARFRGASASEPNRIMFVRSIDGGLSFEDTLVVGPRPTCGGITLDAGQFANVMVHSSGDVHVFWAGITGNEPACAWHYTLTHAVSTDGGASFSPPDTIIPVTGWMTADGGIAIYSQPACDADISGGPFDGNMYIAYCDIGPEDQAAGNADIDFIRSTDNGVTWSNRITINDDKDSDLIDNFHPWLQVNQEGVIAVLFYDQRFDPLHYRFDALAAYSFDGGETFTTNHRISNVSSSPDFLKRGEPEQPLSWLDPDTLPPGVLYPQTADTRAGLLGEYIAITAYYDKLCAFWTDSRAGNSDVYTANWYLPMLEPRLLAPADGDVVGSLPTVRWATSWKHDQDRYRVEIATDDQFASLVESIVIDTNFTQPTTALSAGDYFWRVKCLRTDNSDSSAYSETGMFQVVTTPPPVANLLSPIGGEVIGSPMPTFQWWYDTIPGVVEDVSEYIYVSTDPLVPEGPPTVVHFNDYAPGTEYYLWPDALTEGVYYWKVVSYIYEGIESESVIESFEYIIPCCVDPTGNVNGDALQEVDLSDLIYLVNYLFNGGPIPDCIEEANVNGDIEENVDLSDLIALVNYLFLGGAAPADCL